MIYLTIGDEVLNTDGKKRFLEIKPCETSYTEQLHFLVLYHQTNQILIAESLFGEILTYETVHGTTIEEYIYDESWEEVENPVTDLCITHEFLVLVHTVLNAMNDDYPEIVASARKEKTLSSPEQDIAEMKAILTWIECVGNEISSFALPTLRIRFEN